VNRKDPLIPLEEDLESLINGVSLRTSVFCQFLKETGSRSGEAWMLKWGDIDFHRRTVRITPEKNSNPRTVRVSNNLLDRINTLKTSEQYVFRYESNDLMSFTRVFEKQRDSFVKALQNPRLRQIHFHSFRHWKATTEYQKTRDILHVKTLLGHKRVDNTLKYIRYAEGLEEQDDEWNCRVAKTIDEATNLVESGFEYVTEMDGVKLFRKRK
jgi:integrase